MMFKNGLWSVYIVDDLHPVAKQDTEMFVTDELIELLTQAIKTYLDCLTGNKLS
ncbi:hypothetical protein [Mucilaginibacter flavidus]|uniref:hypothetical protein n=1 Tax=Mucilaginibacter flavidus TaxID=2949309 RepID=UPI002092284E|nr:hypothetical protein [Mucilaginibacter flavidus]MCO5948073.1 hypothetical protein [Mucilaginibacter flavidus]